MFPSPIGDAFPVNFLQTFESNRFHQTAIAAATRLDRFVTNAAQRCVPLLGEPPPCDLALGAFGFAPGRSRIARFRRWPSDHPAVRAAWIGGAVSRCRTCGSPPGCRTAATPPPPPTHAAPGRGGRGWPAFSSSASPLPRSRARRLRATRGDGRRNCLNADFDSNAPRQRRAMPRDISTSALPNMSMADGSRMSGMASRSRERRPRARASETRVQPSVSAFGRTAITAWRGILPIKARAMPSASDELKRARLAARHHPHSPGDDASALTTQSSSAPGMGRGSSDNTLRAGRATTRHVALLATSMCLAWPAYRGAVVRGDSAAVIGGGGSAIHIALVMTVPNARLCR
ncbi:hypothetical protein X946_3143 [Burkholderia sp. ABCPW 111]|nr:hypothetical protein X946_3143 [Burkholderia sp. ABCPW 111]